MSGAPVPGLDRDFGVQRQYERLVVIGMEVRVRIGFDAGREEVALIPMHLVMPEGFYPGGGGPYGGAQLDLTVHTSHGDRNVTVQL